MGWRGRGREEEREADDDDKKTQTCISRGAFHSTLSSPSRLRHDPTLITPTDFGAVGDGKTNNTLAVRKAIKAVAQAGSGTVYFPKGKGSAVWHRSEEGKDHEERVKPIATAVQTAEDPKGRQLDKRCPHGSLSSRLNRIPRHLADGALQRHEPPDALL